MVTDWSQPILFVAFWMLLKVCNYGFNPKEIFSFNPRVDFQTAMMEINAERDQTTT